MTLKYGTPALAFPRPRIVWERTPIACAARTVLRWALLFPILRAFCAPRQVGGRGTLPETPVIFVANHASHADTPLIVRALPRRVRARTAPAAAADYFFRNRIVGALTRLVVGAFPFPRRGTRGLDRAHDLLSSGWSVLLFPEGTRTTDGRMAAFKTGAARLAARGGWTIVPVGVAGTRAVLGKGRRLPRRRAVAVEFAAPIRVEPGADPAAVTRRIEGAVKRAARRAETACRGAESSVWTRVHRLAHSRAAVGLVFAWGAAEALAWPIVPDVPVALLVLAAPRRVVVLVTAAVAGSALGGAAAYAIGALAGAGLLDQLPLVTPRMQTHAFELLRESGAAGVAGQPWSGVPFKVFAYQAPEAGVGAVPFLVVGALTRAARIAVVAALAAGAALVLRRRIRRWYPALAAAAVGVFAVGLAHVVSVWS